ncbi:Electron transfer flavoprotein FAD-binding domain [Phytophthora infestans]|nr:Electron transfer flavoprotein FAD-binding domain [Phytophthora infestans]
MNAQLTSEEPKKHLNSSDTLVELFKLFDRQVSTEGTLLSLVIARSTLNKSLRIDMLARQIIRRVATQTPRSVAMSTLVVAEHNQSQISGPTLATVSAASQIGGDITVLVLGSQAGPAAEAAAKVAGVKSVLHAADAKYDHYVAEEVAELLVAAQKAGNYSHVLAPSSNASKNYLPRAGAKLDVAPISDIVAVADKDTFFRPTYAGNAIAQIKSKDAVKLITVRPTGFEKAAAEGGSASVSPAPEAPTVGKTSFVSEEVSKSERPDLASARVVISGGRGLKSGENFEMLYKLADKLGGAVGASRAAVDAGFVPNELQVGQTGKVVAPELYVAAGISGAIQHLAGMKDSKTIVAINKDEEAPIFQVADYGLVDDLFTAVPELTEKI